MTYRHQVRPISSPSPTNRKMFTLTPRSNEIPINQRFSPTSEYSPLNPRGQIKISPYKILAQPPILPVPQFPANTTPISFHSYPSWQSQPQSFPHPTFINHQVYPVYTHSSLPLSPINNGHVYPPPIKMRQGERTIPIQILQERLSAVQKLIKSKEYIIADSKSDFANQLQNSSGSPMVNNNYGQQYAKDANEYHINEEKSRVWQLVEHPSIYCPICEKQIHFYETVQHQQDHKNRISQVNVDIPQLKSKIREPKQKWTKQNLIDIFLKSDIFKNKDNQKETQTYQIKAQKVNNNQKIVENEVKDQKTYQKLNNINKGNNNSLDNSDLTKAKPPKMIVSPLISQIKSHDEKESPSVTYFQFGYRNQPQISIDLIKQVKKQSNPSQINLPILIEHKQRTSENHSKTIQFPDSSRINDNFHNSQLDGGILSQSNYIDEGTGSVCNPGLNILVTNQKKRKKLPTNKLAF